MGLRAPSLSSAARFSVVLKSLQLAISGNVRLQPWQQPEVASIRQTPMQGEAGSACSLLKLTPSSFGDDCSCSDTGGDQDSRTSSLLVDKEAHHTKFAPHVSDFR